MMLQRMPDALLEDVFVLMPINVARGRDVAPRNFGMACLQLIWQPARCFGDDLQAANNRVEGTPVVIERLVIAIADKFLRKMQVFGDIEQGTARRSRTHRLR